MRIVLNSLITALAAILLFLLNQPSWAVLIYCTSPPALCEGTEGDDIIYGAGNIIFGRAGNDYISTVGNSTNVIYGHDDNDTLIGSHGNDALLGGAGNDYYDGGGAADTIIEELHQSPAGTLVFSNDVISGGEGDDYIQSALGSDRIHGGPGNDRIYPDGYHRDFSFDIVSCGSDMDDHIFYNSGDGDTIVNCELIIDFDR